MKSSNKKNGAISTISEYLKWVEACHSVNNNDACCDFEQSYIFYRGQSQRSWKLQPGLFRCHCYDEYKLLHQASLQLYLDVQSFSNLEKIIYFQHFGLPTRLLDVTYNPLIALFFACRHDNDKDGIVYCGYPNNEMTKLANACADILFNHEITALTVSEDVLRFAKEKYHSCEYSQLCNSIFINPPFNNHRITAQRGAFVMAPILKPWGHGSFQYNDTAFLDKAFDKSAIIKAGRKRFLLKQLIEFGFDEGFIFQDTSSIIRSIAFQQELNYSEFDTNHT